MIKYIRKNRAIWLVGIVIPPVANLACNLCFANSLRHYTAQIMRDRTSFENIVKSLMLTMLVLLLFSCVDDVGRYLFSLFAALAEKELKQDIYGSLVGMMPGSLKAFHRGGWLTRYTTDVEQSVNIVTGDLYGIIYLPIVGGGYLIAVMISDIRIGLLMFMLAAGVIGLNLFFMKKLRLLQQDILRKNESYSMYCNDVIHGKMSVRQYGAKQLMTEKIAVSVREIFQKECRMAKLQGVKRLTADGLANICTYFMTPLACVLAVIGYFELSVVLFIQQICQEFIPYAQNFAFSFLQLSVHQVSYDRVRQVFTLPSERDNCNYKEKIIGGDISFDEVSIAYENHLVLENITFTVDPGDIVALTGESGSGKTTLVKALLQMVDYQGKITIGGRDCADIPLKELRSQVAFSPEHGELFDTTIYENLQYGNLQATEEDLLSVLGETGFENAKESLRRDAGVNGSLLSGGQKQKVSVARAILKNAPIIILDEPTAALDVVSEEKILKSLLALKERGKSVLVITHKTSTLRIADKILQIKDGMISEQVNS